MYAITPAKKGTITKDTPLAEVEHLGASCDMCGRCCTHGSGFVLESELPRITAFLKTPKDNFIKNFLEETEIFHTRLFKFRHKGDGSRPYGPCMFLDGSRCRIHEVKPLHCRISNCGEHGDDLHVWFMLNYCLNIYDPESVRQYVSYIKTGGRLIPGADLETVFPDGEKLRRILDYGIIR